MGQPSKTKLDAGFRLNVTVTLPDGTTYSASRAIGTDAMEQIRQGSPETGASMMLEMLGQQAVNDLREQLAPGTVPSEIIDLQLD